LAVIVADGWFAAIALAISVTSRCTLSFQAVTGHTLISKP
jgi:hypothetical protein